jgi:hypothetical protein
MSSYFYRPKNPLSAKFNQSSVSTTGFAVSRRRIQDAEDVSMALATGDNRLLLCVGSHFYILPFASDTAHRLKIGEGSIPGGATKDSRFDFTVLGDDNTRQRIGKVVYGQKADPKNTGYIEFQDGSKTTLSPVDDATLKNLQEQIMLDKIALLNLPSVREVFAAFDTGSETIILSQDTVSDSPDIRMFIARGDKTHEVEITKQDYYLDGGTLILQSDEGRLFVPRSGDPYTKNGWSSTPTWKGETVKRLDAQEVRGKLGSDKPEIRGARLTVNPLSQ